MSACNNAIIFGDGEVYEEMVMRLRGQGYAVRACGIKVIDVVSLAAKSVFLTPEAKADRIQFMEQNHRGREWRKGGGMLGLEPEIAQYVDRINKNNGICTVESCWGHGGEKNAYLSMRCTKDKLVLLCGLIERFISLEDVYYVKFQHTGAGCKLWFSIVWDGKKFDDTAETITGILENL